MNILSRPDTKGYALLAAFILVLSLVVWLSCTGSEKGDQDSSVRKDKKMLSMEKDHVAKTEEESPLTLAVESEKQDPNPISDESGLTPSEETNQLMEKKNRPPATEEVITDPYDEQRTLQALNLAIVSIQTILRSERIEILELEYDRIINNLNFGEIIDDYELKQVYKEIMNFITDKKLGTMEKERLQKKLEKAQSRAFYRAATGVRAYGGNPLSVILSLTTSVVSAAFNYHEQKEMLGEEYNDMAWEKYKEEIRGLNALRQTFFDASWTLLQKYNIATSLLLHPEKIDAFLIMLEKEDDEEALHMFERAMDEYKGYPPYFYHFGIRAQKVGKHELAKQCFEIFETMWRPVLVKDPMMASVALSLLSYADLNKEHEKVNKYVKLVERHLRLNNDGSLRFGLAAVKDALRDSDEAKELLRENINWQTAAAESNLALRNLKKNQPILQGIEDESYLMYDFEQVTDEEVEQAFASYKKLAEEGDAEAQYRLAECYSTGNGIPVDKEKAFQWYYKSAEQGLAKAQNSLADCYKYGAGVDKDESESIKWYRKSAEQGYAIAQCNLGVCYEYGIGIDKDESEAVKWYKRSAEQGYAIAECNLGVCYYNGTGVDKDESEAVKWYKRSAEQQYARAQCNLGRCYVFGTGVDKDESEAVKWYRKSAAQQYAPAEFNLGFCYEHGMGITEDSREAFKWYSRAAEQGDDEAQLKLGWFYCEGLGVSKDESEAFKWTKKSAEQENAGAQALVGLFYEQGFGVKKDDQQAVKWYRKSAEQENSYGQYLLGLAYLDEIGVEKDKDEAKRWLSKAAEQGHEDAAEVLKELKGFWGWLY